MISYEMGEEITNYENYKYYSMVYLVKHNDEGGIIGVELVDTYLEREAFYNTLNYNKKINCKIRAAIKKESFVFSKEKDEEILYLISDYYNSIDEKYNVSFMKKLSKILEDK